MAALLPPGLAVADVGAGDGRLALALAADGRRVIATESKAGPYEEVRRLLAPAGVELRRGDGLASLQAGEVRAVVLAGMGGRTILRLLRRDAAVARSLDCLILQPMQHIDELRAGLDGLGWRVEAEAAVDQAGRRYFAWRVRPN